MIEANFDTMREVFEQGIERLYEDSARWREGVHSFMATRRENQLWSQVSLYIYMYVIEGITIKGSFYSLCCLDFNTSFERFS